MLEASDKTTHRNWLEKLSSVLLREPKDREQLLTLLRDAEHRHLLDSDALSMIEGVLQVSEMAVRDIMIPRSQMTVLEEDKTLEEILPLVMDSAHSRFPVIGENRDEVVGILLAKDLLVYLQNREEVFHAKDIIRPAIFIPESKRIDALLQEFRINRYHMAIVVDEYGGVAGLVTIEDILEQIVGDIEDEYDIDEEAYIKKHAENNYIIKATTPVETFNEYFEADFDVSEFDTIGGLITQRFARMPKRGENIMVGNYRFEIIHADKRRVHLLKMVINP